ncbi:hypothetical protein GEMRC1_013873 [Eukaryota sp. GEM-RC1]
MKCCEIEKRMRTEAPVLSEIGSGTTFEGLIRRRLRNFWFSYVIRLMSSISTGSSTFWYHQTNQVNVLVVISDKLKVIVTNFVPVSSMSLTEADAAIVLQKYIRGYLARSKLKISPESDNPPDDQVVPDVQGPESADGASRTSSPSSKPQDNTEDNIPELEPSPIPSSSHSVKESLNENESKPNTPTHIHVQQEMATFDHSGALSPELTQEHAASGDEENESYLSHSDSQDDDSQEDADFNLEFSSEEEDPYLPDPSAADYLPTWTDLDRMSVDTLSSKCTSLPPDFFNLLPPYSDPVVIPDDVIASTTKVFSRPPKHLKNRSSSPEYLQKPGGKQLSKLPRQPSPISNTVQGVRRGTIKGAVNPHSKKLPPLDTEKEEEINQNSYAAIHLRRKMNSPPKVSPTASSLQKRLSQRKPEGKARLMI